MTTAATITPRERFREMMRADILRAARQLLRDGGFAALSMRALAEIVGVRAPTLYDYFENKEDVLNALFLEGVDEARAHFQAMAAPNPPGAARVIGIGLGYYDFSRANPELFQLLFGRIDPNYLPGEAQMEAGRSLFLEFRSEVEQAMSAGDFESTDADELTMILWAAVHGVVSLELAGFQDKCLVGPPRDMAARMVEAIMNGVGKRDQGAPSLVACSIPPSHALTQDR